MAELSEQDKQEISDFFAENKRLKRVCASVEESFRAVVAEIWAQANKIDQLQAENERIAGLRPNTHAHDWKYTRMKELPTFITDIER